MIHPPSINILFIASEADPLVKVGGLGDVAGSLPRVLRAINSSQLPTQLDARLVIPFHPTIRKNDYSMQPVARYGVHSLGGDIQVEAYQLDLEGLPVYLINGVPIEQATGVYSNELETDAYKYVFFSQAALNLPKRLAWRPDILHANDWHTSAAVYSLALTRPTDPFFRQTASLLTVHNLPYMGAMTSNALSAFELPPAENTSLPSWANHMALPLGLLTADTIVAVSPGYAKEIMTEEFGSGLQVFLRAHSQKLTGILNGLDIERWDPARDKEISSNYTVETIKDRLINKEALQVELGFEKDMGIPILGMVTRMDPQKGVDLAVEATRKLLQGNEDGTLSFHVVFLGTGNPVLEQAVRLLEQDFPTRVRAMITYNEKLSRHIYAGADMLLMPSRYEPCGLSQMIAMHYGCIPVARDTGGLSDTIQDPETASQSTGFLFKLAESNSLAEAIRRALVVYRISPGEWQKMQACGMQQDFSWDHSAQEYVKQYSKLLESRKDPGKYV